MKEDILFLCEGNYVKKHENERSAHNSSMSHFTCHFTFILVFVTLILTILAFQVIGKENEGGFVGNTINTIKIINFNEFSLVNFSVILTIFGIFALFLFSWIFGFINEIEKF